MAHAALRAGGLPCGAALADRDGEIIAAGRNHAYDPPSDADPLEATPLAHAEMNVLARVPTERDLSGDTLWSTQQPCAMCAAAVAFCGVGRVRYLAADPAFAATDDPRAGVIVDPTQAAPSMAPWATLANVMFLQATIAARGTDDERVHRNRSVEPEITDLAIAAHDESAFVVPGDPGLAACAARLWPRIVRAADERRRRLGRD